MRKPRKPLTLDQDGHQLNGVGILPGESSGTPDEWSFGASVWEFLNPGTVQQEDVAIGKTPRTYSEIFGDAFGGMANAAEETRQEVVQEARNIATVAGPLIVIGVVAAAVLVVAVKRR